MKLQTLSWKNESGPFHDNATQPGRVKGGGQTQRRSVNICQSVFVNRGKLCTGEQPLCFRDRQATAVHAGTFGSLAWCCLTQLDTAFHCLRLRSGGQITTADISVVQDLHPRSFALSQQSKEHRTREKQHNQLKRNLSVSQNVNLALLVPGTVATIVDTPTRTNSEEK